MKRLSDYQYSDDKCDCNNNNIQSPAHLLLSCSNYEAARAKIREKLYINQLSIKALFMKREEIELVFKFLKEIKIARRNWLSD